MPAIYVTQLGYSEPYEYQLIKVDAEGRVFDMAAGGLNSDIHTGFLRIERVELEKFMLDEGLRELAVRYKAELGDVGAVERAVLAQPQETAQVAPSPAPARVEQAVHGLPDPERRLKRLRAMGGEASYRMGKWSFKGTNALAAIEAGEGRPRSSQKTVKQDLEEAAEAERKVKREGIAPSPFPT